MIPIISSHTFWQKVFLVVHWWGIHLVVDYARKEDYRRWYRWIDCWWVEPIYLSMTIKFPYRENPWSRQSARTEKLQRVNNRREALNAKTPGKCRLGRPINVKVSIHLKPALGQKGRLSGWTYNWKVLKRWWASVRWGDKQNPSYINAVITFLRWWGCSIFVVWGSDYANGLFGIMPTLEVVSTSAIHGLGTSIFNFWTEVSTIFFNAELQWNHYPKAQG